MAKIIDNTVSIHTVTVLRNNKTILVKHTDGAEWYFADKEQAQTLLEGSERSVAAAKIAIEHFKPKMPTTPGSVLQEQVGKHFIYFLQENGVWLASNGVVMTHRSIMQRGWDQGDFTVIHDAGKDNN